MGCYHSDGGEHDDVDKLHGDSGKQNVKVRYLFWNKDFK